MPYNAGGGGYTSLDYVCAGRPYHLNIEENDVLVQKKIELK